MLEYDKTGHGDKKLLENHEPFDPIMEQFTDLNYVDTIGAVQALYDMNAAELGELRCHQLMKMVLHVFDKHQDYINWSRYVREHYIPCHPDCHALRIQHFVKYGLIHTVN